jgi:heat shock protein HslJ
MRRSSVIRASALAVTCTLLTVSLSACGGTSSLDGTSWKLDGWSASSLDPRDFTITAQFADGRIGGTSAVNSYGGEYTTGPGSAFSVGEIAQTLMAGPEEDMRAEAAYMELLRAAASYKLNGTTLTLYDANGNESLIFTATAE